MANFMNKKLNDLEKRESFDQVLDLSGGDDNIIKGDISEYLAYLHRRELFGDENKSENGLKYDLKLEDLREKERQILEKRSQVLRFYLIENVIPILSEGILKVSHELPDDPVEELSKFLAEKAKEIALKEDESSNKT